MKKPLKRVLAVLLAILVLYAVCAAADGVRKPPAGGDIHRPRSSLLTALQWTWGLPQNLMGGALYLC